MVIRIEKLNVKIVISKNFVENCYDYLISNIIKVEANETQFHISYAFYAATEKRAASAALLDLHEKYNEYVENYNL